MITLENVVKSYKMGTVSVVALSGVSLLIEPSEFVVVLGPSGSGKSTLLNMISTLDTPTEGRVIVNGQEVSRAGMVNKFTFRRETIGLIFQTFNLFPTLTALENVQFAVDLRGLRGAENRAAQMLKSVGLELRMQHFPHELSGGEQQRVAIARALVTGNPILLADEPTGGLDFKTGIQILQLLKTQTLAGKVVLVVTHNREISRVADRVIVLSSGKIVSDGPPEGGKAGTADLYW